MKQAFAGVSNHPIKMLISVRWLKVRISGAMLKPLTTEAPKQSSVFYFLLFRVHDFFYVHGAIEIVDLFLGKQQVLHAVYLHPA